MNLPEFVYASISRRLSVSKDEFLEQLKEWTLTPMHKDGKLVAVAMVNGSEVHVAVDPAYKGKWLSRGQFIKGVLAPVLAKHGEIFTRAEYDNTESRAFIERLGFTPTTVFYSINKLKHIKEQECHYQP